jgi:hypothetical protein
MSFCVYRSHTVDAYSTIGLTKELYAFCFVVVDLMFRFLRKTQQRRRKEARFNMLYKIQNKEVAISTENS